MSLINWQNRVIVNQTKTFANIAEMFNYLRILKIDVSLPLPNTLVTDESVYIFDNNNNKYIKQTTGEAKVFDVNMLEAEYPEVQQHQTGNDIQTVTDYVDSVEGKKILLTIKTPEFWNDEDLINYISEYFLGIIIENAGPISGTYYSYNEGDRGYNWIISEPGRYMYYETIAGISADEFNTHFTEESNLIFLTRELGVYIVNHNLNTLQPIVYSYYSGLQNSETLLYSPSISTPAFAIRDNNTITIPEYYLYNSINNIRYTKVIISK